MVSKNIFSAIENKEPVEAIKLLCSQYPGKVVFTTSLGQEDQVITDIIFRNGLPVRVITLDTGRLFNQTYDLIERTAARYNQNIEVYFPDANDVEQFVSQKGINGFYESVENRKECCYIRKVKPLNRALDGAKVWVTGLRAGQSEGREKMPIIEWMEDRELYKYNPLINWSLNNVLDHIEQYNVPYNPLHNEGFISIGCAPCTRAIQPGEQARDGRWWWESSHKECGLHHTKGGKAD